MSTVSERHKHGLWLKIHGPVSSNEVFVTTSVEMPGNDELLLQRFKMNDVVESNEGDFVVATCADRVASIYKERFYRFKKMVEGPSFVSHFCVPLKASFVELDDQGCSRFVPAYPLERVEGSLRVNSALYVALLDLIFDLEESDMARELGEQWPLDQPQEGPRTPDDEPLVPSNEETIAEPIEEASSMVLSDDDGTQIPIPDVSPVRTKGPRYNGARTLDAYFEEDVEEHHSVSDLDMALKKFIESDEEEESTSPSLRDNKTKRRKHISDVKSRTIKERDFKPQKPYSTNLRLEFWWNPPKSDAKGYISNYNLRHANPFIAKRAKIERVSYDLFCKGEITGGSEADKIPRMVKPTLPDGTILYEHQQAALSWLAWRTRPSSFCRGAMICDEAGLGKTLVCIAFMMMRLNKLIESASSSSTSVQKDPFKDNKNQIAIRAIEDVELARETQKTQKFLIAAPAQLVVRWMNDVRIQLEAAGYKEGEYKVVEINNHTLARPPAEDEGFLVVVHVISYTRLSIMYATYSEDLYMNYYIYMPYCDRRVHSQEELEASIRVMVDISRSVPKVERKEEPSTTTQKGAKKRTRGSGVGPQKKSKAEQPVDVFEQYPDRSDEEKQKDVLFLRRCLYKRQHDAGKPLTNETVKSSEWFDAWPDDYKPSAGFGLEMLSKRVSAMRFFFVKYDTLFCDETSNLTRTKAKCTAGAMMIDAQRRILVTASPIVREHNRKTAFDLYAPLCILGSPDVDSNLSIHKAPKRDEFLSESYTKLGSIRRTSASTRPKERYNGWQFGQYVASSSSSPHFVTNYTNIMSTYIWRTQKTDLEFHDPKNESSTDASRHLPEKMPATKVYNDLIPFDTPEERELYRILQHYHATLMKNQMAAKAASDCGREQMMACNDFFVLSETSKKSLVLRAEMDLERRYGILREEKQTLRFDDLDPAAINFLVRSYDLFRESITVNKDDITACCCICFEPMTLLESSEERKFEANTLVLFPSCAHGLCHTCMLQLCTGDRSKKCPLCRRDLAKSDVILEVTARTVQESEKKRNASLNQKTDKGKKDDGKGEARRLIKSKLAAYNRILFDPEFVSTKTRFLKDELHKIGIEHPGDKVVVICQIEAYTTRLCQALAKEPIDKDGKPVTVKVFKTKGTGRRKVQLMEQFRQAPDEEGVVNVLFLTYKSGSMGHNLQFANHLFLVHPNENNAMEFQARGRITRLGQVKEAHTHRVAIQDSIEENLTIVNRSYRTEELTKKCVTSADENKKNATLALRLLTMNNPSES